MAYDMDIILGGDVGGVLTEYMIPLGQRVLSYNGFDRDISYLKNCSYEKEASAVGAAKHFLHEYVKECVCNDEIKKVPSLLGVYAVKRELFCLKI